MNNEVIVKYLEELSPLGLYIFLFFSSFLENLFPPWPGDTFIVLSGFLAAQTKGSLPLYFLASLLGNAIGATLMYYAGEKIIVIFRNVHDKTQYFLLRRVLKPLCADEGIARAKYYFQKWGVFLVLFSRFSAGVRFFVSIVAGIVQMNFSLFLFCFAFGVIIWNSLLLWGGWQLKANWNEVIGWLQLYNTLVIIALFTFLFSYLLYKRKRSISQKNKNPS